MNTVERAALKVAMKLENTFAGVSDAQRKPRIIEPYIGHATPEELILKGRIHSRLARSEVKYGQSRFRNVGQMLGRFMTSEVAGANVSAEGVQTTSDEEGYFELRLPREGRTGWIAIPVTLEVTGESVTCECLAPEVAEDGEGADASLVISDIDDTVMKTGAYSLARNLWTSFTGNLLTRQIFSDSAVLLDRLHDRGRRPVFYVSSSPWNLHDFLQTVFARGNVAKGPMFLRDLGIAEDKLITQGHGNHKGQSIDTILDAHPGRRAVLIGDTGQKDAKIYAEAVGRHGDRIRAVLLREPGPGADAADRREIEKLKDTGILVLHGPSFAGMSDQIEAALGA